eukprot:c24159_g1_i1 orf=627-2708(-)
MVSLSVFSAAALLLQQQQPKQQVISRVSLKAFKLHCLPQQDKTLLLINKEPRQQLHALDTISVEVLEGSEVLPLDRPRTAQQEAFLEQLALEEEKRRPTDKDTDPAARAVARCLRNVQQASGVDAFLHDLHFDAHVYSTAIQKLGHWNMVHQAFCLLQWLQSRPIPEQRPNVYIYSSILGAMKSRHDFLHFSFVMDEMRRNGIEPNLITYNNIIECYQQQGFQPEAMMFFLELVRKGLVPTKATFKALLWACEKSTNIRKALSVFVSARDILLKFGMDDAAEELRDFVSALCSRIICVELLANKGPDYVIRFFEMAEASTLEFSARHYDDILRDCGSGLKDYVVAKFILMRRWKLSPLMDVGLCNHIMKFMGKEKKWWAALEVFEHMTKEGPPPNATSYTIVRAQFNFLLKASKERGTCRWNMQLLEKMEAHGIRPDQYAWDTTLVACAMRVDPDLAVHVFEKMIEKGHQPNVLSYGALLTALEKGGLYEKAEQVWEHMKRLGVKPNIRAYTIMISVYGAAQKYEELRSLLDEMSAAKVKFTLITYNTLITMCAKASNGEGALEWMQQLVDAGLNPDATSYNQLVIALSRGGQVELAKDMFIKAKQSQFAVSQVACESLVKACNSCNVEFDPDTIALGPDLGSEVPLGMESELEDFFPADAPRHDLSAGNSDIEVLNGSVSSQSGSLKAMIPS